MAVRSLKNSTLENFANYSSSMNAGYSFQDYELIESVFVASTTSSIAFNNLDQFAADFKHLQIRAVSRSSRAGTADFTVIRFNNDTTGYSRHGLQGNGSSVVSYGLTDLIGTEDFPASGASANQYGATIIDILDSFSTTKNTTVRIFGGVTGTINFIQLTSGLWIDTSSVSSIKLESGNFAGYAAGSRFSLYGIR